MPLVSTRALILQAFPYSDTSKILRLFTLTHGLRSVIAKGAQRPKSRFGGLLEPFTEGEALFFVREGRDLHTLSGFDLLHSRQRLGRNLAAFAGASLLAELVLRSSTEEPHPALYRAIATSLDEIAAASAPAVETAVVSAVWQVVALLGYRPETEHCVGCGRRLDPLEPARFDAQGGGVACGDCRPRGRVFDATSRAELRRMLTGERLATEFSRSPTQRALLWTFLSAHLGQERPLRSLELLVQQLG